MLRHLFDRGGWQGRRGLTIIEIQEVNKHQQNQTRTILFFTSNIKYDSPNNRKMAGAMRKYLTRKCRYFSEADIKVCVASYNGCGKALHENVIVFQPVMKVCVGGSGGRVGCENVWGNWEHNKQWVGQGRSGGHIREGRTRTNLSLTLFGNLRRDTVTITFS